MTNSVNDQQIRQTISLIVLLLFTMSSVAQTLQVASFNLRYDNKGDSLNAWSYRKEAVSGLIKFHEFDIIGTQEGLAHQLEDLKAALPHHTYIGVGRDDGQQKGEHSAIFYDTDKFELLESGDFWLAEETDKPVKGWDAALPRICTWGKFNEKASGTAVYFFNLHFDHVGVKARAESAKLVLAKIEEITEYLAPIVLTGDFNVDQHDESYQLIHQSGTLVDSYEQATFRYGASGTFNSFNIHSRTESRIDHIFVSNGIEVHKHGILTDFYQPDQTAGLADSRNFPKEVALYQNVNRLPSDHFPVMAKITITH